MTRYDVWTRHDEYHVERICIGIGWLWTTKCQVNIHLSDSLLSRRLYTLYVGFPNPLVEVRLKAYVWEEGGKRKEEYQASAKISSSACNSGRCEENSPREPDAEYFQ